MFSVDPLLFSEDPERYTHLLYREGHYRNTVGFWQHFARGVEEHGLNLPIHDLLSRLRQWDPEWWRSLSNSQPAAAANPLDWAALQSLIQASGIQVR
jgi:hypothetical protein